MKTNEALIVLSGGQDSTVCLFWARQHFDIIHALSFDYGQRHRIELEAAEKVAAMAGVTSHEIVELRATSFDAMTRIVGDQVEQTFVPPDKTRARFVKQCEWENRRLIYISIVIYARDSQ